MKFRPCIDLHQGRVKQIIGSTLREDRPSELRTNFVAAQSPAWFAELYKRDGLTGGHVIMLGPGNEEAAREALQAFPGGLQVGGGITAANARDWIDLGAAAVIVTSYVFKDGHIYEERLMELARLLGPERLVLDLSCRRKGDDYYVVTDRWQKFTTVKISAESLAYFARFCSEFLIHAADVEGKCQGVDRDLVSRLGDWTTIPTTYAGGVSNLADLDLILHSGRGRLDATIGSSLDIFGGSGISYEDAVAWHRRQNPAI